MAKPYGAINLNRRAVCGSAAALLAGNFIPKQVLAQANGEIQSVNDRIDVIFGLGGNIVVARGAANAIVVDSGRGSDQQAVLAAIATAATELPVTTLFNTHWHLDQIGANAALRSQGAEIIAHEKTLAHLQTPYYLPAQDRYQEAMPADAHPTTTFYRDGAIDLDSARVHYGYLLEPHTDGDIFVGFERDNVIAVGDAISPERDPVIDWYGGGWLGGRVDVLAQLLASSDSETRFIPSYGPVVDRSYVAAEYELMQGLFDILWDRVRAGEGAEDIYASGALDDLPRRFDDPMKLLYDTHKSMWAHYNTLSPDIV